MANNRSTRRASSRREKIARKESGGFQESRLQRKLKLKLAGGDGCQAIHDAVLTILWEVGVIIEHLPTRRELISRHRCVEGQNGFLRLPKDLVNEAISTVPDRIQLFDQNGHCRVDTSADISHYCPGHNCVRILDHRSGELRPCLLEDIREVAKVCDQLQHIDMVCSLGYPSDIPAEDEVVETVRAMMENSAKPAAMLAHDEHIQQRMMNLVADIAGGWNTLADKPVSLELMGPISPLKLPDELCARLINCARWRVPVVCYPATFPGMSSPITPAGAIAQSSAEALAGIVIHQLAEPGAPVMSGSAILPMDMRQANLAYGSPEYMLTGLGASDYFQSIGVPSWVGAGCSDSHQFDAQAAAEAGSNLTIAAMAGTPFVHNLGFLSGGRTGSLEMLVLCDELVGWVSRMAGGIDLSPDAIAAEVVKRAAPDNSFLTDQHTQDRYLTENWFPALFERSDADAWLDSGANDMQQRVRHKLQQYLG